MKAFRIAVCTALMFAATASNAQDSPRQILRDIFPPTTSAEDIENYLKGLEGVDINILKKLLKINELRKDVPGLRNRNIQGPYLDEWVYLIKQDIPLEALAEIDQHHLISIVKDIKSGRLSKELVRLIGSEKEMHAYAKNAAERDPDFSKGADWARKYIEEKLTNRKHVKRSATDYTEDVDQLKSIKNPHVLFLTKRIIDYFDTKDARIQVTELFSGKRPLNEEGELILECENKISFVKLGQDAPSVTFNPQDGWRPPLAMYYMAHLGSLHTHPLSEGEKPEDNAGPSGYARVYEGYQGGGDTYVHRYYGYANPWRIDVVASEVSDEEYNVDLMLSEVTIDQSGEPEQSRRVIVLDIGNFPRVNKQ